MNVGKKGLREGRGDEWIKEEKREGWRKGEKEGKGIEGGRGRERER